MHFLQPAVLNFRQRFRLIFSQAEVWIQVGLENLGQVSLKVYAVKLILLKLKNKWADYQAPNRSHWAFSYHCISSYVVFGDWCGAVSFLGKHKALSSWACFASMLTELCRSPAWGWASPVCVLAAHGLGSTELSELSLTQHFWVCPKHNEHSAWRKNQETAKKCFREHRGLEWC